MRSLKCGLVSLVALLCVTAFARAGGPSDYDRYYKVLMEKAPAGWMRLTQVTKGNQITTTREMKFSIARGDMESTATMKTTFVETAAGKAVSMSSEMAMGARPVVVSYTFEADQVRVVSDPNGASKQTTAALPKGDWLTPAGVAQFVRMRLAAGAKEITYKTLDPLSGLDADTITHASIEKGSATAAGRTFEGFRMKTSSSGSPGVTGDDFVDLEGNLVIQSASMGGLAVTMELAGPEVVQESVKAPELMVSTFVRPDRPIMDARRASQAAYVLEFGPGDAPTIPETGSQSVESIGGLKYTVRVNCSMPNEAPAADWDAPQYRNASAIISSEDAAVVQLAARAVKGIPDDQVHARAEAIRGAVERHIHKKDLSVGFASAAEVATSRQGDCTEHAVLLAAALRSAGIPARIAGGLIYADEFAGSRNIFGYHMWAQALVRSDAGLRWVDLDATLDPPGYDATHLALVVSSLSDAGATQDLLGIAGAMGRLSIRVVEVEHRR